MIHRCDPTVVICYLIWPCDIAVHITYLISHSSSLSYNTVIKGYFRWMYNNTKLPSCVDIIRRTSLGFPSWCPESTCSADSCFQGTSCENLMMNGGLYQHTRVVLYMYYSASFLNLDEQNHWFNHENNYLIQAFIELMSFIKDSNFYFNSFTLLSSYKESLV